LRTGTYSSAYFDNDNRWQRIVWNGATADTTTYSYTDNQLTSISGSEAATFSYDDNGNLTMQVSGSDTVVYDYDLLNRLVDVTINDTTYGQAYNVR
jgi:YD repeat-containing protein